MYDPEWHVLGCANLVAEGRQVWASARFTGNITGELRLAQSADSLFAETSVYLRLHHSGEAHTLTLSTNCVIQWRLHMSDTFI